MKKLLFIALMLIFAFISQSAYAQFRTDSNTTTTKVGNPSSVSSNIGAVASELASVVSAACEGAVTSKNISCMQGLSLPNIPHKDLAINEIVRSATANYCDDNKKSLGTCLQCVGFVQGAVGGALGAYLNNGGNAKDFATNVPSGYQYIQASSGTLVAEGDIIIKTGGGFGHIAVVTKVYDSSLIQVAEANFNYGGQIGLNNTALSLWNGWLRKQ